MKLRIIFFAFFICVNIPLWAQIDPYLIDTLPISKKELNTLNDKFKNLSISGYIQTQFQKSSSKGIESYNGGDFADGTASRFMIRRGRMRINYTILNDKGFRKTYLVFQFDATERGVFMRDMFLRLFENKWQNFVITTGMFNRPFGYELQMSSAIRESPERGRMSQILMRTERDLGAMISFRPQDKKNKLNFLSADFGIFNGPGLISPFDYDNFKDLICRISINDVKLFKSKLQVWGGASYLNGGIGTTNKTINETLLMNNVPFMVGDTLSSNLNRRLPRQYYGVDFRCRLPLNQLLSLEFRSEYIFGRQTSLFQSSNTPNSIPMDPTFIRSFNGTYFYLVGSIEKKHQFVLKYDWYDPNSEVKGIQISSVNGFSQADVKYSTLGFGYSYFFNALTKIMFYYDIPKNEKTLISGYDRDKSDNTFTVRTQLLF